MLGRILPKEGSPVSPLDATMERSCESMLDEDDSPPFEESPLETQPQVVVSKDTTSAALISLLPSTYSISTVDSSKPVVSLHRDTINSYGADFRMMACA